MGYGASGLWWGLILGPAVSILMMFWRFHVRMSQTEQRLNAESPQCTHVYSGNPDEQKNKNAR
jgi:hypothetical protein